MTAARKGLSDFDYMLKVRLVNWGKWGRHDPDKPDANRCGHSICSEYIPKSGDWEWERAPEMPPPPIDDRDADNLDGFIIQLREPYKENIRRFFYKQLGVRADDLYEAVRMLLDLTDANRATVDRMYKLVYGGRV